MRRVEMGSRGPPPFRILGDGVGQIYVIPPTSPPLPPMTLAPEPYKVGGTPSSTHRARRRSSFVIIAEARPATPSSRSPSPNPASGRVSPFRGRGFKGPLPHAQSRPQTPEAKVKDLRRPSRVDRRMSISQQNSPKRSLIPQPARRRSVSLSKSEGQGKASPKFGRRAAPRNNLEAAQSAPGRRGSVKVPGLSPIQGTPTRPVDKKHAANGTAAKRPSPIKSRRNSLAPPGQKISNKGGTTVRTKPPIKGKTVDIGIVSPSKIPLKKGPQMAEFKAQQKGTGAQISVQNARRGSLAKLSVPKNGDKNEKTSQKEKGGQKSDPKSGSGSQKKTDKQKSAVNHSGDRSNQGNANGTTEVSTEPSTAKTENHESLSLMELLKQSSGASGTSSVVNTTTVTAAQPLQIDSIPMADEEVEKEPEVKRRNADSGQRKNGAARPTAMNLNSPSLSSLHGKLERENSVVDSEEPAKMRDADSTGPKSEEKKGENGTTLAQNLMKNYESIEGIKTSGEEEPVERNKTPESGNRSANQSRARQQMGIDQQRGNVDGAGKATKEKDPPISAAAAADSSQNQNEPQSWSTKGSEKSNEGRSTVKSSARTVRSDNRGINEVDGGSSDRSYSSSAVVEIGGVRRPNDDHHNHHHMGSAASIKSTTGLSNGSTDTGVSVNTVRGISSAREKRGMHMVKQSQGIETLSGNVVHLEQNGEPTLAAEATAGNSNPRNENQGHENGPVNVESTEVDGSRWKRILGRCCGCCKCDCSCCSKSRTMRCLACRRGLKSQINQPTMFQEPTNRTTGCLSKLKSSSRCCSLARWKGCCSRGSRIAPVENSGCCPPERKCGAVFRRLFSWCNCKRQETGQQTRNVQAKQSLTSIAAPVLPEEPKSKIPEVLVEHNALMRGAIPCLPIPLAWFCLVWNVLIPGTGTFWSGLFNLCVGQPRFSTVASPRARLGAFLVNTVVGVGQLFTVLFCLVGWGWSIWWGVMMVRLARKYKRFRDSEAANNDVEARGGNDTSTAPPGVPNQVNRGVERAR